MADALFLIPQLDVIGTLGYPDADGCAQCGETLRADLGVFTPDLRVLLCPACLSAADGIELAPVLGLSRRLILVANPQQEAASKKCAGFLQ